MNELIKEIQSKAQERFKQHKRKSKKTSKFISKEAYVLAAVVQDANLRDYKHVRPVVKRK